MIGICKHCELEKDLRKSHIIPKHFFKNNGEFYDKKNRASLIYSKDGNVKYKTIQDITKEFLYCDDCELIFSDDCELIFSKEYENPVSKCLFGKNYKLNK